MKATTLLESASKSLQTVSDTVDSGIARAFRSWGYFVSRRPYLVIWSTTIFALVCTAGFFTFFDDEKDNEDLFTPKNAESFDDQKYVDDVYGSYTARARILSIRHKDARESDACEERLLLRDEETARENIRALFKVYQEIEKVEIEYDHVTYGFTDICVKTSNPEEQIQPCLLTSILDIWNYNETIINGNDFNPLQDINSDEPLLDRNGVELDVKSALGKDEDRNCEEQTRTSSNVEAFGITLIYSYEREDIDGEEFDPESRKWIEELAQTVRDISKSSVLDTYLADVGAVGKESDEEIQNDIQLLTIGYVLIILYTNVVLFKNNWHSCKVHLTFVSVIGIGFALMTAFGLAQTIGVKFNTVVQVLPFLILGLGIDDTFVIIGAYHRMPVDLPVPDKISQTLERAGSSIFVTSATDFCAFLMGLYTTLPALEQFSAHAALAIFFDFFFQVTFFVAFLVLEARREARYRNGSPNLGVQLGCRETEYDERSVQDKAPKEQEMNNVSTNDVESSTAAEEMPHARVVKNPLLWRRIYGQGEFDPTKPSFATRLAGTFIPAFTLHPLGKIAVIIAECVLLGVTIYGCTQVKMNFNYVDMFTPDDSPLKTGFNLEEQYFSGSQVFFSVYTREPADGDYFYHQDELRDLRTALEADPYVVPPVTTWFEGFEMWLDETNQTSGFVNGEIPNARTFNTLLMEYLNGAGTVYKNFVLFTNGSNPRVFSSQIDATTVDIIDGEQSVDLLDSIRDTIEGAAPSLDPIPFAIDFLFFDGYRVIAWETVRNVMFAALGVFIMNVVVLASIPMALIVVGMVALTDVMLFGYMWYVNQYFNPVTAINLVLAVGIAVDYSAHIAHSFLVLPGNRLERAKGALEHIGGEVLSGAFTTWLGIVLMAAANHYIFQSFFKMFFAIIVAGAWHGVILLPVVLSLVGSPPYASKITENANRH